MMGAPNFKEFALKIAESKIVKGTFEDLNRIYNEGQDVLSSVSNVDAVLNVAGDIALTYTAFKTVQKTLDYLFRFEKYTQVFTNSNIYVGQRYPHLKEGLRVSPDDMISANNLASVWQIIRIFNAKQITLDDLSCYNNELPENNLIANGGYSSELALYLMGYNIKNLEFENNWDLKYRFNYHVDGECEGIDLNESKKLIGKNWEIINIDTEKQYTPNWDSNWEGKGKDKVVDYSLLMKVPNKLNPNEKVAWLQAGCHKEGEIAISELIKESTIFSSRNIFEEIEKETEKSGFDSPYFQALFSHEYDRRTENHKSKLIDAIPLDKDNFIL